MPFLFLIQAICIIYRVFHKENIRKIHKLESLKLMKIVVVEKLVKLNNKPKIYIHIFIQPITRKYTYVLIYTRVIGWMKFCIMNLL